MSGGGFFQRSHCEQEIQVLAAHGINSIRMVGSFWGWLADRDAYLDCLRQLARVCADSGVVITYALWNSTPWGHGAVESPLVSWVGGNIPVPVPRRNPGLLSWMFDRGNEFSQLRRSLAGTGPIPWDEEDITQYPSPGPDWLWDVGGHTVWNSLAALLRVRLLDLVTEYMIETCKVFTPERLGQALGSIDLYNEPDALFLPEGSAAMLRIPPVFSFLKYVHDLVREILPDALCTVGWAGVTAAGGSVNLNQHLKTYGVGVDYYSFHSYADRSGFPVDLATAQALMPDPGVPLVCSEFWKSDFRGHLASHFQALAGRGMGGQMWGFLQHNAYWADGRDIGPRQDWPHGAQHGA
jgi:hypothetical protein